MKTQNLEHYNYRQYLLPLYGFSLFFILYLWAALLYPGGSNVEMISSGYSFSNNYWCDLMAGYAKNGAGNPARPVAITAWIILCFSLGLFWIHLPGLFSVRNVNLKIIQYSGTLAAFIAMFSFTRFHDRIIDLAGIFGTIALIPLFIELKKARYHDLLALALFSFFLGLVNYVLYASDFFISKLPVLQKVTYGVCLFTFGLGSYRIYLKGKNKAGKHKI